MKKHRISKRIFAMLLVICMVFTMLPANAYAYEKGDVVAGDMGMTNIQDTDKITWPIEIYDYSNDGMLFEYASYTGNEASWAQLDKNEEYCYIPDLTAGYYADFTTDAILNTQVVRRWFDVWGTTYSQTTNQVSGMKYFTFPSFTGLETELIDFRDPDTDDVIEWCGDTNDINTIPLTDTDGAKLKNAYGYTFIIDHVDEAVIGGDAAIVGQTVFEAYTPNWAYNVVLEPTGTDDKYTVVKTIWGNGAASTTLSESISWTDNTLVMMVHADGQSNWMDWRAANALEIGDVVTISENKKFVTVEAAADGTKSGTVSSDAVKYATLVYRTYGATAEETVSYPLNYANTYAGDDNKTGIFLYATTDETATAASIIGQGEDFFGWKYGILLQYSSTSDAWEVVVSDFASDGDNAAGYSTLGDDKIAIIFTDDAGSGTYAETYEFLKKYAKVGAKFALSTDISTLLSAGTDISSYSISATVPVEEEGTVKAFFRTSGSEEVLYSNEVAVPLSGYALGSDWRYCVIDLTNQKLNDIQSAGIYLDTANYSYDLMVSHFALFGSKEEAEVYGEKALVYNKHYIQTLYPDNATYSADYTTSEIANATHLESYWFKNQTYAVSTEANGRQYYTFTNPTDGKIELIDFNTIDGVNKNKLKYAVLVAYVTGATYCDVSVYFRDKSNSTIGDSENIAYGVDGRDLFNGVWASLSFDLTDITSMDDVYSAGILLDGHTGTTGAYEDDDEYSISVKQFAFFETPEERDAYIKQIEEYNKYSEVPTSYYNPIYDNLGYGLLMPSREGSLYDKYEYRLGYNIEATTETTHAALTDKIYLLETGAGNAELEYDGYNLSALPFDGYQLYGTLTGGSFTAGLLEGTLGKDGNPVYREQVIDYLAQLLKHTLVIPEYEGGYFNYDFVRGEKSEAYGGVDLATAIRECVGIDFNVRDTEVNDTVEIDGTEYDVETEVSYNDTTYKAGVLAAMLKGENLKGTWAKCKEHITTCYDAAYFLLNNLFEAGSYNEPQDTYDYLTLHKATLTTDENSKEAYVFDAGLSTENQKTALVYKDGIIDYSNAAYKHLYYTSSDTTTAAGTTTTLFPFLPVTDNNTEEGMTKSPYFADPGVGYDGTYGETYYERDFNYVMKSSGEFVYREDDGLFFDFEGDDDVYLFINGQLVLDIGGAHSITKQSININDYVQAAHKALETNPENERAQALAIEEGDICSFDFFYMERHGYGANCRIATNMRVTDPSLRVEKTAYQNGEEVAFGGVVNEEELIEYNFKLENTGNTKLYNLTFTDESIGVTIDYEKGLEVKDGYNGVYVFGKDTTTDKLLDPTDLTAVVTGYKELEEGETTTETTYEEVDGVMVESEDGNYIYIVNEITFADDTALKDFMKSLKGDGLEEGDSATEDITNSGGGLWKHSTVTIKGIYYQLTEGQVDAGKFNNTVVVTATTKETIDGSELYETLRSQAEHRVFIPGDIAYYQWAGHDIVITPTRLLTDMKASSPNEKDPFYDAFYKNGLTTETISKIEETNFNGRPITTGTVSVDKTTHNVTVNYSEAGGHVFYLKITYSNSSQSVIVPVVVNSTAVQNSYTVLDYGLTVELTEENGILKHDTLTIAGKETTAKVVAITSEKTESGDDNKPKYDVSYDNEEVQHIVTFAADADGTITADDGTFVFSADNKLTYKPSDFMDGTDTIWAAVHVYENGFDPTELNTAIDIGKEVQMFKKVSVLPANVVYYEDDFPAINYTDEEGNLLTPSNTFERLDGTDDGEYQGSANLTQSADQDQEYGRDDAYDADSLMSGNSITQITINAYGEAANFEFTGTGFELISRTKAERSATIIVKVTDLENNLVKNIPVITEFDNGADGGKEEIYQVPVIRVDDLAHGSYKVSISAMPTYVNDTDVSTTLYIDGFRIFNPLAETTENTTTDEEGNTETTTVVTPGKNEHYNDSENGAIFEEIRKLIINGQAAIATYDGENLEVSTGTVTWTENRNDTTLDGSKFEGNTVSSVNDYLAFGPNNEVYMDTDTDTKSALVFYVEEQKGTDVHNLQIAFRAMDKGMFVDGKESTGTAAAISYGVKEGNTFYWTDSIPTTTTTEQYYTINYKNCPYVPGKGYQVAIKLDEGMVSYTSLKYNGLTIANMDGETEGEAPTLIYVNGVLTENSSGLAVDNTIYPAFSDLRLQFIAKDTIGFDTIEKIDSMDFEELRYQTRNGEDVRLIAFVKNLTDYTSISFTLTIDGNTTKELVCTTAYKGLYANGNPVTTEEIYGEDGYFVTYTINGYLASAYAGKEVTITATYITQDGTEVYEARKVIIGTETTETNE